MPSEIAIDSTQRLQGMVADAHQTALMSTRNNQRLLEASPDDETLYDKQDHLQRVTRELEKMGRELEKLIPATETHPGVRNNYHGARTSGESRVTRKAEDGNLPGEALPERQDIFSHSPNGFGWGYHGPEPAQLALAILADATEDDDYATRWRQVFKREVIAGIRKDHWTILGEDIEGWVKDHQ